MIIGTHQINACKRKINVIGTKHDQEIYLPEIQIITAQSLQLLFLQLFISQFLNCVPSTHNKHRDKHTTNKQVQLRTEHQAKQKHKRAH